MVVELTDKTEPLLKTKAAMPLVLPMVNELHTAEAVSTVVVAPPLMLHTSA